MDATVASSAVRRIPLIPTVVPRAWWVRTLMVAVVWIAAAGCTMLTAPYIHGMTFAFFWVSVLFAAWSTGIWHAIVLSLASVVAANIIGHESVAVDDITLSDVIDVTSFVVASLFVSALASRESRTSTALRAGESQFRTLTEVSPVGIIIASPLLESVYLNPRAREITGLEAHEITADAWRDLMHPDDREAAMALNTAFRERRLDEYTSESRLVRHDGDVRWVRVMARWMRRDDGMPVAMVLALDDVTRERQLEARLQHAQKMEAVGQLAGGIAHDFNNLLTVITGNLEFLRDELPAQHPAQQDLQHIAAAADRARLLVKQLLAFGRRQMLKPQEIDLGEALRQAERWFARVLGDEISCRVRVAPGQSLRVRADPTQLDQVLLNLAVNARDAMLTARYGREGTGGELRLEADRLRLTVADLEAWPPLQAGEYVRLRASDTGHGMDDATRARVFEPFFTTKDIGHGSGLGLAMVEGIVAQSGGAIKVESRLGLGTTFTILLPAVDRTVENIERRTAPERTAVPAHGVILVVEDERTVRRTTRRTLVRAGYEVHEASNGVEALEKWGARGAELTAVVTDIRMPHMSGTELARQLRLSTPNLPIVFVSGYNDELDRLHSAYDVFLEKPFTRAALLDAVERAQAARGVS
jgi:PAS domain S-box-containing protein